MKNFFKKHSYSMMKMFLNQFATAIFGFVLMLATGMAGNIPLRNATSVFAVLFYLFLLYVMTWEIGYRDRAAVETGKQKRNSFTGILISLCANIPNFLFALFILLAKLFPYGAFSVLGGIGAFCAATLEGMYSGILLNYVGGMPMNAYGITYFLTPLPAILICGLAYTLGLSDIKFTKIFDPIYPESDREPRKK